MTSREIHLVIDARPRGPRGLLAAEVVLGQSMLEHQLDLAVELVAPSEPVVVHARADDHGPLRELVRGPGRGELILVTGPPPADATVLRTDRFYDSRRLKRGLRRGLSPESAVLWRLDRPESLRTAEEELNRRLTYQPLGKYWAFPLARGLAQVLSTTRVRPNHLTVAAGALMLTAAGVIAFAPGGALERSIIALALALALVLDTADGRLARLQGTSSAFGRWLDQVLDELADLAIHAAIAWAAFCRYGSPTWLVLGILYAAGKYLFLVQSLLGNELESQSRETRTTSESETGIDLSRSRRAAFLRLTQAVRMFGHADLRWHLWIALAVLGHLEAALAAYAIYFPARALAGSIRKGLRHA